MTDEQIAALKNQVFFIQEVAAETSIAGCCGAKYGWYDMPTGIEILVENEPVEPGIVAHDEYPRYNIETISIPIDDSFINARINRAANFDYEWEDLYESVETETRFRSSIGAPNTKLYSYSFETISAFLQNGSLRKYDQMWNHTIIKYDVDEALTWWKEEVKGKWLLFILVEYQLPTFHSFIQRTGLTIHTEIKGINNLVHDNNNNYNYLTAYLIKA